MKPMKPIIPSTILRDSSASFARNNSYLGNNGNRFNSLRDNPNGDSRSRSPSVKRKAGESNYANAAKKSLTLNNGSSGFSGIRVIPPPQEGVISAENLEIMELNLAKISSICEKLDTTILAIPEENPCCPILRDFCAIFHIQSENSKLLVDALRKVNSVRAAGNPSEAPAAAQPHSDSEMESDSEPFPQMVSLGRVPRARSSLLPSQPRGRQPRPWGPAGGSEIPVRKASPSPSVTPAVQSFRDLVKEAEKSTVIFNLDMGRVPIINKSTMCVKATSALTAMAAAAEERPASNPSRDTVDAIDDAISVAEGVSFFGRTTKSVKGRSENSGSFCTIPVCYSFPDRETRIKAEQVIRSRCKASCSTPYPQSLRECIKQVLDSGRQARPADFCSVSLDLPKLSLRVAWRAKGTSNWTKHHSLIPIPEAAIQNTSRVPEGGYQFVNLPSMFGSDAGPPISPSASTRPAGQPSTGPPALRLPVNFFDTVVTSVAAATPP